MKRKIQESYKSNINKEYINHCKEISLYFIEPGQQIEKNNITTYKRNFDQYRKENRQQAATDKETWEYIKKVDYYRGIQKDETKINDFDFLLIAPMYVYTKLNFKINGDGKKIKNEKGEVIGHETSQYLNFWLDLKQEGAINQRYIRNLYNYFKFDESKTKVKITKKKKNGIIIESVEREKTNNKICKENEKNILGFQFNNFSDLIFEVCNILINLYQEKEIKVHKDFFDKNTWKVCCNSVDRYIGKQAKHSSYNKKNQFSFDETIKDEEGSEKTRLETFSESEQTGNIIDYMIGFEIVENRDFLEKALQNMKSKKGSKQTEKEKKVLSFLFSHNMRINETSEKFEITGATIYNYLNKFIKHAKQEYKKIEIESENKKQA